MKDERFYELKNKHDKMLQWSASAEDAVCAKIESVRLSGNYSLSDFSDLLSLPYATTYQNMIIRHRAKVTLDVFLRFSYLFGYDIRSATAFSPKQSALDRAVYELAALFASCTCDGLHELANHTDQLQTIPAETRRKLALALRELSRIVERTDEEISD